MSFIAGVKMPEGLKEAAWWFAFKGSDLLVSLNDDTAVPPFLHSLEELNIKPVRFQYLGLLNDKHCYSAEIDEDTEPPKDMSFRSLRSLLVLLDEELLGIAGRAFQIVEWDRNHQFCGRCGSKTAGKDDERAKVCPVCGLVNYPRISPAIIVAVVREGKILLAHAGRFNNKMYSVVAGFVEAGETFEECVQREVKEEVNIEVKNIRYFGSQPWPFPNSIMIGFTAEYAGGELKPDGIEILDAKWFSASEIPLIPGKWSIARKLIDWFIEKYS